MFKSDLLTVAIAVAFEGGSDRPGFCPRSAPVLPFFEQAFLFLEGEADEGVGPSQVVLSTDRFAVPRRFPAPVSAALFSPRRFPRLGDFRPPAFFLALSFRTNLRGLA